MDHQPPQPADGRRSAANYYVNSKTRSDVGWDASQLGTIAGSRPSLLDLLNWVGKQSLQKVADTNRFGGRSQVGEIGGVSQQSDQSGDVVPLSLGCFVRFSIPLQLADDRVFSCGDRNLDCRVAAQGLRRGSSHRLQIEWPLATDENIDFE
jgi:hypothetical protein